jgi:hypothetical protein
MSNLQSKLMSRLFRQVGGVVWDLTSGKTGVRTNDGIATFSIVTTGEGKDKVEVPQVSINLFEDFGIDIPAFASNVALKDVKPGDLLVGASAVLGWVVKANAASINYQSFDGHNKTYSPPKVEILGAGGDVQIVRNMGDLLGGNQEGFANSLLPLVLLSKESGNGSLLEGKLPLLLMMGQSGNSAGLGGLTQVLMMQAMSGGEGSSGGLDIESLMMMQALGGGLGGLGGGAAVGGMNPMMLALLAGKGGLGGGKTVTPAQPVQLRNAPPLVATAQPSLVRTR